MAEESSFSFPEWYKGNEEYWPEGVCLYHDRFCRVVENDRRLLDGMAPLGYGEEDADVVERREINIRNYLSLRRTRRTSYLDDRSEEEKRVEEEELNRRIMEMRLEREQEEREEAEMWKQYLLNRRNPKPVEEVWRILDRYDNFLDLLSSTSRKYLIRNNGEAV